MLQNSQVYFVLPYIHLYQSSLYAWNKTESMFKTCWTVLNCVIIFTGNKQWHTPQPHGHNRTHPVHMHQVSNVLESGVDLLSMTIMFAQQN